MPKHYTITIDEKILPIVVRKHAKARRIVIRYRQRTQTVALTLPRYVSVKQGLRFIQDKRGWITRQMEKMPANVPFCDGAVIPMLGKSYAISHRPGRGVVHIENDALIVPGEAAFIARRVRDWLIETVRDEITRLGKEKSARLGKKIRKISLRDTVSHWGSCNKKGNLSFSWRLAFAPYAVLDYIVCHEAAHLVELNHSARFWSVVAELCPGYERHEAWLKKHGESLYHYG